MAHVGDPTGVVFGCGEDAVEKVRRRVGGCPGSSCAPLVAADPGQAQIPCQAIYHDCSADGDGQHSGICLDGLGPRGWFGGPPQPWTALMSLDPAAGMTEGMNYRRSVGVMCPMRAIV